MRLFLAAVLAAVFFLTGCGAGVIDTTCPNDGELAVVADTVGTGLAVFAGSGVRVTYTGTLENGTVFESGVRTTFNLNSLIEGWRQGMLGTDLEGVAAMREGGVRRLVIPPNLAYGATRRENIPACSVLQFDIELFEVLY